MREEIEKQKVARNLGGRWVRVQGRGKKPFERQTVKGWCLQ